MDIKNLIHPTLKNLSDFTFFFSLLVTMDFDKLDKSPTYIMIFIATVVIIDQGSCLAQDYHSCHHCHTERLLSGSWLPRLPLPMETDSCLVHDYHGSDCHWKHTLVWFMIIMATIVTGDTETFFWLMILVTMVTIIIEDTDT